MKRISHGDGRHRSAAQSAPMHPEENAADSATPEDAFSNTESSLEHPATPSPTEGDSSATPASPAKKPKAIRVLIVDDHPIVRTGFVQMISWEPDLEVCGESADAGDALRKFRELKPDLMLIDISLPGVNGIELVKQVRALDKDVVMMIVTLHDGAVYAERALRAGAMGYVNKEEPWSTIIAAIRHVMGGQVYLNRDIADRMLRRMTDGNQDLRQSPIDALSDRELEVFGMIGRGITTSEIAKKLFLSTKTIESHREKIKTKLRLRNASELIQHAVQWTFQQEKQG